MTGTPEDLGAVIATEAAVAGIVLDAEQVTLAGVHAAALLTWNPGANLTRVTEPRDIARRHFVESLLAASLLPEARVPALRVLDVGSGGGFPGLALRLVRPDAEVVLLEPRQRKAAFLRAVAAHYPAPRTRVVATRLEDYRPEAPFDVVTYRAVRLAAPALLAVLAPGGRIVAFPGREDESLAEELSGAGLRQVGALTLPDGGRIVAAWES